MPSVLRDDLHRSSADIAADAEIFAVGPEKGLQLDGVVPHSQSHFSGVEGGSVFF